MDQFDEFADELLRTAPQVAQELRRGEDDVRPDPEFPGSWLSTAGRAVVRCFDRLDESRRVAVLAMVERHLATGTQPMKDAVATEFLEALASAVSGHRLDGPTLARYLGKESRAYLDAWDQFTMGRSTLDPT
ncbi:MAG: hypothetical protein WKF79_05720 [Nocardioides sp.]